MKHSPQITLIAARAEYESCCRDCSHWDAGGFDSDEPYECCYALEDARRRLKAAIKATEART